MQDYLIVKSNIDQIETENPPAGWKQNECHVSDALAGVGVLYSAIVFDNCRTMEETLRHL